jgi:hypothetical protein
VRIDRPALATETDLLEQRLTIRLMLAGAVALVGGLVALFCKRRLSGTLRAS